MNNMNMAMASVGGPVGGMPMMNNGAGSQRDDNSHHDNNVSTQLNTYIYDYFLKNELYDCARSLLNSNVPLKTDSNSRTSPGRRRDADGNVVGNGVDDTSMGQSDSKDDGDSKRPDSLPAAAVPPDCPQNSFLFDWWCVFWEMFGAQQRRGGRNGEGTAMQYMQHTQTQQRLRQEQQQFMLRQQNPQMMAVPMGQYQNQMMMRGMPNGMNIGQNEMARTAMKNSRNSTPQQIQMAKHNQQMMQQQREVEMEMNGQRPQSPASAENAPSPSKRPRLEGGQFNGQPMVPNGRGQPPLGQQVNAASAQQAHNLLIANGINPNQLTASQFNSFQQQNPGVQQKSIQVYAQNLAQHQRTALQNQVPKGMPNAGAAPNHGSPMMQQGSEGGQNLGVVMNEFYAGNNAPNMRGLPGQGTGPNHALQDYQMQLMLLEQQNKKRLLMARQEQDNLSRTDQPGVGQPGFQGMSPQGSRAGPSPNPADQMKRGTPKMNQSGLPGSPMPDNGMPPAQQRNSPAAMGFTGSQIPPDMGAQGFYHQMKNLNEGVPNGNVMRPPSSVPPNFNSQQQLTQQQLERQMNLAQQQRVLNGNWQQGQPGQAPMMTQHPQGQQAQQMGTPQQRNAMPPPSAPPAGNNNGRTQPSSPQQNQAPPTPQQSNKANPKGKKEGKEPRKPARKKGSAANLGSAATPSSEPEPPPTPTPSTPITPVHPSSFAGGQKSGNGPAQAGSNGQTTATTTSAAAAASLAPPQPDSNQVANFPMDTSDNQFNMDFGPLDGGDVLDQFDFDSFLNTDDTATGAFVFDAQNLSYAQDGGDTGTGE